MGKGIVGERGHRDRRAKEKHKNISKRQADRERRVKEFEKSKAKDEKVAHKKREFELKKLQKKKGLVDKREELKKRAEAIRQGKNPDLQTNDWEDVDEHEKDVFDKDGYFDVLESEAAISKHDQTILQSFQKPASSGPSAVQKEASGQGGLTLAELIMQKMSAGTIEENQPDTNAVNVMDPKVVAAYKKLGVVLKSYRSGKLPKAFKVIPLCANWEELLFLTQPENWSPHATLEATKIFASNLNTRLAQRFYYYVLLPNVRKNIETYKKLNCHLYMAVKKAIFKVSAFFKGFLLPLAEDATAREAVIIGSILAKMSINNLDSAAAIIKLTQMPYQVGNGFFLKTLLQKKYALPTQVITALLRFFFQFSKGGKTFEEDDSMSDDEPEQTGAEQLPVMWH